MAAPTTSNGTRARRVLRSLRANTGRTLGLVVGSVVLVLLVLAWMPQPVPVDVARARRAALTATILEDGRARIRDRFLVSAPLTGTLARVELHPGDVVPQGAVLARLVPIDSPLLDARSRAEAEARLAAALAGERQSVAAIERAKAALALAETQRRSADKLATVGAEPRLAVERAELEQRARAAELSSAEFGARVAEHQVAMARATVDRAGSGARRGEQLELRSPVAGVVLRVLQESAGVVHAGAPLIEVGDPRQLEIVVDVLTAEAARINPGAAVRIIRWGGQQALAARVRLVEPSAFTRLSALGVEEQRVNVIVDLSEPYESWHRLADGFRVEAEIVLREYGDALAIPESAAVRSADGWAVFTVDGGRARRSSVQLGERAGADVQILAGIAEGDTVIVYPSDQVTDGVRVAPR